MKTLLVNTVGGVVGLAVFAGIVAGLLVAVFDLRVEFAGSGMRPIFSFGDPDDHYAALEADRSHQPTTATPAPALIHPMAVSGSARSTAREAIASTDSGAAQNNNS